MTKVSSIEYRVSNQIQVSIHIVGIRYRTSTNARSKLRTKEQIGPLHDMTGNLIDEPKRMAMLLNEFFSSVFTTEDQTNIPSLDCEVELMADITITTAEVQKKLQDLRTDKAPGADLIHPRLLKRTGGTGRVPLGYHLPTEH